jgi:hypothetical protein
MPDLLDITEFIAKAENSAVVHNTGTETIAGVKTFSSSPIVPTPTAGGHAVTKAYADSLGGGSSVEYMVEATSDLDSLITAANANPTNRYNAILATTTNLGGTTRTIPSNVYFENKNGAKFNKNSTGTLAFAGVGFVDPLSRTPMLSGFAPGNLTFSGTVWPEALSTELFDTANASLSERVRLVDAALAGKRARIHCYPRTITTPAVITEYHHLYFDEGDYPNTLATFAESPPTPYYNWAAFLLKNHTRVSGAPGAVIYESDIDNNVAMFWAYHLRYDGGEATLSCEDIIIEDLYIRGSEIMQNPANIYAALHLGNCVDGAIRRCKFHRVHGYVCFIGSDGGDGYWAKNSNIEDCIFRGCGSQIANMINGEDCGILRNKFIQDTTNSASGAPADGYVLVDCEPNTGNNLIRNLRIEDNLFDFTNEVTFRSISNAVLASATDVNATTNILTYASHHWKSGWPLLYTAGTAAIGGLVTGNTYWVIASDVTATLTANQFKLASTQGNALAGTAIDITSTGTGSQTFTPQQKFGAALTVHGSGDVRSVFIKNNKCIGSPTDTFAVNGGMYTGMSAFGIRELVAEGNYIHGAGGYAMFFYNCTDSKIRNNDVIESSDVFSQAPVHIEGFADSSISGNYLSRTAQYPGSQVTSIYEDAGFITGTSVGTLFTKTFDGSAYKPAFWWPGRTLSWNGADYVVSSVDVNLQTATFTTSLGTVPAKTAASATDINAGTGTITITSHGFNNGCWLRYTAGTAAIGGLTGVTRGISGNYMFCVVNKTANTFQLALTPGGTPITFSSTGTGTQTFTPTLRPKWCNSTYSGNRAPDGLYLSFDNTSAILDTYDDRLVTNVADADHTALRSAGIIVYTSLTAARTVSLPSAVMLRGKEITIKDGAGAAGSYNITLDGSGSETIDGAATLAIKVNYGSVTVKSNGANWITVEQSYQIREEIVIPCSDETTAVTTGTGKVTFRMPFAMALTAVRASVTTAPTGSTLVIDINENGSTILSTKLSIDATEKTSTTAASAAVISDASLADDAEITIDFDQVGSGVAGAGVKVALIGYRS